VSLLKSVIATKLNGANLDVGAVYAVQNAVRLFVYFCFVVRLFIWFFLFCFVVCLFICLFLCLVCLFVCLVLFVCFVLFVCLFVCLSVWCVGGVLCSF